MKSILNAISAKLAKNRLYLISLSASILIALAIGAVLMAVTGFDPVEGYGAMFKGAFGSMRVFGNTITKAVCLCLTGLAMSVAAKAGMFNVGGEGQLFLGGLAATMTGVWLSALPVIIVLPLAFLSAMTVGGFYALVPAWLKVKIKVSEVITTIMLNSVAIYVCAWLVNSGGPLITSSKSVKAGTDAISPGLAFSQLIPRSNLSTALFYSAVIAFLCWYFMEKTSIGLEMKVTGENERFSFFAGLKKDRIMIMSMVASGAICGLVGMFEVYGYQKRFLPSISNEFYYDGMLVAMITNYSPVGIILMSFFFAIIAIGSSSMEMNVGISGEIADIIFSVIIFLMAAEGGITRSWEAKRIQKRAKARILQKKSQEGLKEGGGASA